MFRNRCNYGDVDFCIACVPKRIKSASPGRDGTRNGQQNESSERKDENHQDEASQKCPKLFVRYLLANELNEGHELQQPKDTC